MGALRWGSVSRDRGYAMNTRGVKENVAFDTLFHAGFAPAVAWPSHRRH
jgi:hypothetical protein